MPRARPSTTAGDNDINFLHTENTLHDSARNPPDAVGSFPLHTRLNEITGKAAAPTDPIPSSRPSAQASVLGQKTEPGEPEEPGSDIDINLIPTKRWQIRPRMFQLLVGVVVVLEFLVLLGITLVVYAKASARTLALAEVAGRLRLEETKVKKHYSLIPEFIDWQQRVALVNALLESRTDWFAVLKWFEENLLPEVYLSDFSLRGKGSVQLTVQAVDFLSAAQQMKIFLQSAFWDSVSISQLKPEGRGGGAESTVSFQVEATPHAADAAES